jgi:hypothetical protein
MDTDTGPAGNADAGRGASCGCETLWFDKGVCGNPADKGDAPALKGIEAGEPGGWEMDLMLPSEDFRARVWK